MSSLALRPIVGGSYTPPSLRRTSRQMALPPWEKPYESTAKSKTITVDFSKPSPGLLVEERRPVALAVRRYQSQRRPRGLRPQRAIPLNRFLTKMARRTLLLQAKNLSPRQSGGPEVCVILCVAEWKILVLRMRRSRQIISICERKINYGMACLLKSNLACLVQTVEGGSVNLVVVLS